MHLDSCRQEFNLLFKGWIETYIEDVRKNPFYAERLLKSQEYSLISGGKRFRPFLAFLVYSLFSNKFEKIRSLCLSLEMIHTYSLIHDDLPCMDNDDLRRGIPTNHKVFSESVALLAGDGLLSDVFSVISTDALLADHTKVRLIKLISEKIGSGGMVSGQVLDMMANNKITLEELKKIHLLKTSNLIQSAAIGGAIVAEADDNEVRDISDFAYHLGMAFQIKDDLIDGLDKEQDFKSYLALLGAEKTQSELLSHTSEAVKCLEQLQKKNTFRLKELIDFNLKRIS